MAWGVGFLLAYVNERTALEPGDIFFTGTMSGVGHEDGRYLEPGQLVEITIEGIGALRTVVGPRG
jgi:2-keto-4-pentenoate hydratase/2-oxohepta-3-ene-1,7-dioic acid hydratase in catechol pathway